MASILVDSHCHLDLYPDFANIVMECEREGVHTLAVTTTPRAWPHNHQIVSKTRFVQAALGLHPQLVSERAKEIEIWESYLPQTRYVGEVGLDAGIRFYKSLDIQKRIFERILSRCSSAGGKILTVHSVRTVTTVLDMIEKYLPPNRGRVVLHWFTGTKAEARRAVELNCYFSINAEMLKSDRHRNMITTLPLDRILTETDGPFCQNNGQPLHPKDVFNVVDELAPLIRIESDFLKETIFTNFNNLNVS